MNNISLLKLFLIFVKIGAISLGGGYVILPIITAEFSDKKNLISSDDILDYFALSQSLPGIIAANISMFIGYKLRGKFGALIAIAGVTFVPFWTIVILATLLESLVNNSYVSAVLWGVGVAVIALITLTVRELWQNSKRNLFFYTVLFASLIGLFVLKLSPIQTILLFSCMGVFLKKFVLKEDN